MNVRIASFNCENFGARDNEPKRCDHIVTLWKANPFDVIMIYEVLQNDAPLRLLALKLSKASGALWGMFFQGDYFVDKRHVGCLYRRDVAHPARLSWTIPDSLRHIGANEGRTHTYSLHRILVIQIGELTIIGAHLKSLLDRHHGMSSQDKRDIQIEQVVEWIQHNHPLNVVFMGDFNSNDSDTCVVGSSACNHTTQPLHDKTLHLTHLVAKGTSPLKTWKGSNKFHPTNLDHVFVSTHLENNWNLTVVDSGFTSDHNLLLLTPNPKPRRIGFSLIHKEYKRK